LNEHPGSVLRERQHAAPVIAGLRIAQIDYRPEIGERRVMPCAEAWREMDDSEVRAADALLQTLTNDPAAAPELVPGPG
jgi:hypothetical protein